MEDLKSAARSAKRRLKSDFWQKCKKDVDEGAVAARQKGLNESKVKSNIYGKVKQSIKGERPDAFYLRVKELLDTYGEVSDAIGRLTDKELYETLSYDEKQRYNLELSEKYLAALEKYRREKEMNI